MTYRRRVLITDRPWPDLDIERNIFHSIDADVIEPGDASLEKLADIAPIADAIGICWAPFPGTLLERCRRCRIVARFGMACSPKPDPVVMRVPEPCRGRGETLDVEVTSEASQS